MWPMMRGITELQRRAWPNWFFTVSAGLSVGLMACLFVAAAALYLWPVVGLLAAALVAMAVFASLEADSQATRNLALAVLVLALALALAVCAIVGLNRTISELQSTPSTTRSELTLPKLPWSN